METALSYLLFLLIQFLSIVYFFKFFFSLKFEFHSNNIFPFPFLSSPSSLFFSKHSHKNMTTMKQLMITNLSPTDSVGSVSGIAASGAAFTRMVSPLLGGALFAFTSRSSLHWPLGNLFYFELF